MRWTSRFLKIMETLADAFDMRFRFASDFVFLLLLEKVL